MKGLIRWILNHIPRRLLQRVATWAVPLLGIAYIGRGRRCPLCGTERRRFLSYGYVRTREDALCPRCLSLERHRAIWLYITRHTTLLDSHPHILHIAPELSLMRHFRRLYTTCPERYITADLESPLADMHFDVQQIPLTDASVDVVICNHLFEHIADDRLAMRELYRVLRPGGWGIMVVPEDRSREVTFEDDSITDPAARTAIFGQYDHRRIYGRDYDHRLEDAGFSVERITPSGLLSSEEMRLYATANDDIVVVRKD